MNLKPSARLFLGALAIVILTFAVYAPVIPGSFLMDDARLIDSDNPLVDGKLTLLSLWFGTDFTLTTFVWWVEHLAFGMHPAGYHLIDIFLQAVSSILLWRLLARLKIPGAWLAGVLFAVHPVCVNSVARIAELKNTLSMPFCLLSFIAYLRYETTRLYSPESQSAAGLPSNGPGTIWYTVSLVTFILALMAKTTVVMLPVALLLCAAWQRGRVRSRDVVHTAPFFILALAFGLLSIWFQKYQAIPTSSLTPHPASLAQRFAGAGYNFWFYLAKALFPLHLNLEYPRWHINPHAAAAFAADAFACALFVVCLVFWRSWGRHALFGLGCFAIMLFPALGFFDAQYELLWQVSDHLQYAALPAITTLVAAVLATAATAANPIIFRAVAILLVAGTSLLCVQRARVFRDETSLVTDTISKNPAAWGALNDLGVIDAEKGDYFTAASLFERSLKYNPDNIDAHENLGYALVLQRKYPAAEAQYLAALKMDPHQPNANKMYARLLQLEGKNSDAIRHYKTSMIFTPDADTCMDMATLDYATGKWRNVVTDLHWVLALRPAPSTEVLALNNLAWVMATSPDKSVRNGSEAVRYAEQACRLTGFKQYGTLNTLAAAYAEAGHFPDAITTAEMALQRAQSAGDKQAVAATQRFLEQYRFGKSIVSPK